MNPQLTVKQLGKRHFWTACLAGFFAAFILSWFFNYEKIMIHNMNRHSVHIYGRNHDRDQNWPYAKPEAIYKQLQMHEVDDVHTVLLFEILAEQIELFTAPENKWDEHAYYSKLEQERAMFKTYLMYNTETIQSRLIGGVDRLKADQRYQKYHHLLPDIEFDAFRGRQKSYEL